MTPSTREEQRALVASAPKRPFATKFAWLPKRVKTAEWLGYGGGHWEDKWTWLARYHVYNDDALDVKFVLYLSLPEQTWYPGIEGHPFVQIR
jgi:hypothetical protein